MEINKCTSAVSAYNKITAYEGVKKEQPALSPALKNVDTIEISADAKNYTIENKKAEIKKAVKADASPERIAKLKDMISSGAYNVSAESVAAAIFEG
jgi:anti-sigma28 factor (negative regulator of flagellin synthesis)